MTLEELKSKKVTITLNKTIVLGEDIFEDELSELLEDQEDENYSDKELLEIIKDRFYGCDGDLANSIDFDEYKITIS